MTSYVQQPIGQGPEHDMLRDRYGLEVSTSSDEAHGHYLVAMDRILAAEAGVSDTLLASMEADPQFALPHSAMARHCQSTGRPSEARHHAETAARLADGATDRECQQVEIVRLLVTGRPAEAFDLIVRHVEVHPRDALALAPATGVFGLLGFSGRIDREAEQLSLLEPLATHYGDDWWFQTALGFALVETGAWERGRQLAERALQQRPGNPHAAHTLTHALYEAGEDAEAASFLEGWLPSSDRGSLLHCHIWWHYALQLMGAGRNDEAWSAFSSNCLPGTTDSPSINVFTDSASYLWRSELAGVQRDDDTWRTVRAYYEEEFPRPIVFVDAHVGLAYAALGETEQLDAAAAQLHELGEAGSLPAGTTAASLTKAYEAFVTGKWGRVIEVLEPLMGEVVRIGGSRAQRDLVTNTLLAAYVNDDRHDEAASFLHNVGDRQPSRPIASTERGHLI